MNWDVSHLDRLPEQIWRALELACADANNPLRTPAFATADELEAAARTVVLRWVDAAHRQLVCFTDSRSTKMRTLRCNPRAQWLFYEPKNKVQIRASGPVTVHHGDGVAREAWAKTPLPNRVNYCTALAPGSRINAPEDARPAHWRQTPPTLASTEAGFANFTVLVTTVEHFEWLQLGVEFHCRAAFTWDGERFQAHWLVP